MSSIHQTHHAKKSSRQSSKIPASLTDFCLFSDVSRTIRELDIRVKPARRAVKEKHNMLWKARKTALGMVARRLLFVRL